MGFFDMKWRLVACRAQSGYTQKDVAELLGTCEKTIVSWESGQTAPTMSKAQRLSELYGIPLAFMDFTKEGNSLALKDRTPETGVTL